jgi:SAM-dependent methyltransferase
MHQSQIQVFACPNCKGALSAGQDSEEKLECKNCRRDFPFVNQILRFVDSQSYAASFGKEWTFFDRTQLDSANGTRISESRFHQLSPIDAESLKDKVVLEAGCGMGRFLEIVGSHGANVFGVDLSIAVESAARNCARLPNVCISQADLFHLPFHPNTFDFIYSFGVIHCTPSPAQAVRELTNLLKPGGHLTVWVYGRRIASWIPRPYKIYGLFLGRLPYNFLIQVLRVYASIALAAGRLPVIGKALRFLLPVQDLTRKGPGQDGYEDGSHRKLSKKFIHEWAWLNAFDSFTPRYTTQHSNAEIMQWFTDAKLINIKEEKVRGCITGQKPRTLR